ncbi:MAG TPA: benzoate-CoA ligase family protein [Planctomycetota bacterium]|nr:benzoate-CoA ligase family protein [Planctomycetota bacterium]HRR80896.1 benzoate-CoA ligase family protein [Planctomycetota bacterium]HRT93532.1 benzoate-CoA ligase family protein [Planctomycetota bacterium]
MATSEYPERLNAATVLVDDNLAAGRGEKPALLCGERTVTYAQLAEGVNRFGNLLRNLGVRLEERVALLMPDTPELVFAFFGSMKIGAVAIPMNTLLTPKDYEYLLNDSRARTLVIHASLLGHIEPIRSQLRYLEHVLVAGARDGGLRTTDCGLEAEIRTWSLEAMMAGAAAELDAADTSKDDSAFWLYSSGTTGFPKGAIHLHHDMLVEADLYASGVLGLRESDVCFSVAKLFFAYGLGNGLYFALRVGGANVLLPGRPTPEAVFETVDRYQPTVFYSVPTSYAQLLHLAEKAGRTSLGRVRMCVSAGEPLPKPLFERWRDRFGVEILDGIGSTEILHIFISNRPGRARAGSTGEIVPGYEARITDEAGRELPAGEVGTLFIKGDSIAAGYWNKHEQTKATFQGEWINTHDKFSVDRDGYYWYAGRTDDMIKVSGMAVWPTEVEAILQAHPAVLESGVAGVEDAEGLAKPFAFVVLKSGHKGSPALARELQEFVKDRAAKYKYPRWVEFVHELPKTATGKIQRYKLRELGAAARWLHDQQQ